MIRPLTLAAIAVALAAPPTAKPRHVVIPGGVQAKWEETLDQAGKDRLLFQSAIPHGLRFWLFEVTSRKWEYRVVPFADLRSEVMQRLEGDGQELAQLAARQPDAARWRAEEEERRTAAYTRDAIEGAARGESRTRRLDWTVCGFVGKDWMVLAR